MYSYIPTTYIGTVSDRMPKASSKLYIIEAFCSDVQIYFSTRKTLLRNILAAIGFYRLYWNVATKYNESYEPFELNKL